MCSSHRVCFTWREKVFVWLPTWQNHKKKKRPWSPYPSCLVELCVALHTTSCLVEPCVALHATSCPVEPCVALHTTWFLTQTNPSGHVKLKIHVPWWNHIHCNLNHMTTRISFVSSHVLNVLNYETWDKCLKPGPISCAWEWEESAIMWHSAVAPSWP